MILELSLLAKVLIFWYIFINVVMFISMGMDKSFAKRETGKRVPEKNLFVKTLIGGGALGLLGMKVFRHKTKKNCEKVQMQQQIADIEKKRAQLAEQRNAKKQNNANNAKSTTLDDNDENKNFPNIM